MSRAPRTTPIAGQLHTYWARRDILRVYMYKVFYFSTDLPSRHAFHTILDLVWEGPAKSDIPQPDTSTDFWSLNHTFSIPAYRSAVWEKSQVKDESHPQVRGWVQTRRLYSGIT